MSGHTTAGIAGCVFKKDVDEIDVCVYESKSPQLLFIVEYEKVEWRFYEAKARRVGCARSTHTLSGWRTHALKYKHTHTVVFSPETESSEIQS